MYLRLPWGARARSRVTTLMATLVAGAAVATACGTANAQTAPGGSAASPAPSASPAASGSGNPSTTNPQGGPPVVPAGPASQSAAVHHLPIFDFVGTYVQSAYGDKSQIHAYDPLDIGGTVRVPVTRAFSLSFDRLTGGTINQALEPQRSFKGVLVKPGVSRDIILQYHGTYAFSRALSLDIGDSFRHRIYNNDASGVSNRPFPTTVSSTEHHFAYAGLIYTTPRIKPLFNSVFVLGETVEAQNVDHHVGVLCSAANVALGEFGCTAEGTAGVRDENPNQNRYYETTQSATWLIPVDAKRGATLSLNERWGALNFYENAPFPYRYSSALTYLFNKRFSPGFTLGLRHSDYHSLIQGAPFAAPGVIHVGSWDVLGTFHLDANTLFH